MTVAGIVAGPGGLTVNGLGGTLIPNGTTPLYTGGTLTLSGANTYIGGTVINSGDLTVLVGNATPLGPLTGGSSSNLTLNGALLQGSVTMYGGVLQFNGNSSNSTPAIGTLNVNGGANLVVDNTVSANNTTLTVTNLNRAPGGTLIITPYSGTLNSKEIIKFTVAPPSANGIAAPYMVVQNSGTISAADFIVAAAGTGITAATYTPLPAARAVNTGVYQTAINTTLTASESAYALQVVPTVTLNLGGQTLTLGGTSGQAGLILDGLASITGGTLAFGNQEGVIYSGSGAGGGANTISSAITGSGGVTFFGPSPLVLSGANTYTGTTTVAAGTNLAITGSLAAGTTLAANGSTTFSAPSQTVAGLSGISTGNMALFGTALTVSGGGTTRGSSAATAA